MILVDALYINSGGGKVLLDYLIQELEKTDKKIYYLLDNRIKDNIQQIKDTNKVLYLPASFNKRHLFYKENKNLFSTVLCFGNLPPNIRLKAKVYTYFHQLLFLKIAGDLSAKQKVLYWLKTKILNHLKKNTDYWLVQSSLVKNGLVKKYGIASDKILELPFYPPFDNPVSSQKFPNSYLYVSNANPHKNHGRLIEAFSKFYEKHNKGVLTLTVSDDFTELVNLIQTKQKKGIPIKNIGFVPRQNLQKLYAESEFLIFPSLTESFGLGLVEAIESNCKVIGADLPYTYAVCEPSLSFNPWQTESIIEALSLSLQTNEITKSKVKNEISTLINLLD
mgnify:CR=1 FL=1